MFFCTAVLILIFPGERRLAAAFFHPRRFFVRLAVLRHTITAFWAASADHDPFRWDRPPAGYRRYHCRNPPRRRIPVPRGSDRYTPWKRRREKDFQKARGRLHRHTEEKTWTRTTDIMDIARSSPILSSGNMRTTAPQNAFCSGRSGQKARLCVCRTGKYSLALRPENAFSKGRRKMLPFADFSVPVPVIVFPASAGKKVGNSVNPSIPFSGKIKRKILHAVFTKRKTARHLFSCPLFTVPGERA